MIIKYWGVALTVAAFISLNAEANTSSLFHQLLKSVQNGHSIKDGQIASDGGDGDSTWALTYLLRTSVTVWVMLNRCRFLTLLRLRLGD